MEKIDCDLMSERTGVRNICAQYPHNPERLQEADFDLVSECDIDQ